MLLLVVVAAIGVLGYRSLMSSPTAAPTAGSLVNAVRGADRGLRGEHGESPGLPGGNGAPPEADGAIPDGATVFDDQFPGVANLDPALLAALRTAAADAGGDGVEFLVTSGWRSPGYQERLLQEAVSKYGSEQEAARWVATPDTSTHVAGDGVDLGSDATAWLSERGADYGLCQIYGNEPWHYELRPDAAAQGCPAMYADPSHDPRLQP